MGTGSSRLRRVGSVPSILLRYRQSFRLSQLFGRQDSIQTLFLSILRDKVKERNDYKMRRHNAKFPPSSKTVGQYVYEGDFQEEYEVLMSIGEGAESEKVLLVRRKKDKKKYACKVEMISRERERALLREFASATGVRHSKGEVLSMMLRYAGCSSLVYHIYILTP